MRREAEARHPSGVEVGAEPSVGSGDILNLVIEVADPDAVLVACAQADAVAPKSRTMPPNHSLSRLANTSLPAAPDVGSARAAEEAALRDIEAHLGPESRDAILSALKGSNGDGRVYLVKGKTKEWSDRYERYYTARAHRIDEELRQASIVAAKQRGSIHVVVALATPPNGTVAAVLRRRTSLPSDVTVLVPDGTAETLGAAFSLFDKSRELYGDELPHDLVIGLQEAQAMMLDPTQRSHLEQLMSRLRSAPSRSIVGVGTAQAIDLRSQRLRAPSDT